MTRNGRSVRRNGAYSSCSRSATSSRRTPTTTRSGLLKSSIAAPSLRNSGLLATSNGTEVDLGHPPGQLGVGADRDGALDDDDLGGSQVASAISRPTAQTPERSAPPSLPCGVPTAMKTSSASAIPSARSVVNVEPAVADVAVDQLGQARLVDRDLALLEPLDLGGDLVHADHVVAALGQAGPRAPAPRIPFRRRRSSRYRPLLSAARSRPDDAPALPAGTAGPQLSAILAFSGKRKCRGAHSASSSRKSSESRTEKPGRTSPPSSDWCSRTRRDCRADVWTRAVRFRGSMTQASRTPAAKYSPSLRRISAGVLFLLMTSMARSGIRCGTLFLGSFRLGSFA